jgi:hypothetical protein
VSFAELGHLNRAGILNRPQTVETPPRKFARCLKVEEATWYAP